MMNDESINQTEEARFPAFLSLVFTVDDVECGMFRMWLRLQG